jgi:hypothetical protein
LIGDNFIYQICAFPYELEYYEKEALSSNFNIYNIKTGNSTLDHKTSYKFISQYKDNLIFAQDYQNLNICYFENNTFTSVYKFDFNNSNLCILKNNDLIIFGEKKIWKVHKRDDGSTFRDCIDSYYYYKHYEYLSI